jgi:hypothetical protein
MADEARMRDAGIVLPEGDDLGDDAWRRMRQAHLRVQQAEDARARRN